MIFPSLLIRLHSVSARRTEHWLWSTDRAKKLRSYWLSLTLSILGDSGNQVRFIRPRVRVNCWSDQWKGEGCLQTEEFCGLNIAKRRCYENTLLCSLCFLCPPCFVTRHMFFLKHAFYQLFFPSLLYRGIDHFSNSSNILPNTLPSHFISQEVLFLQVFGTITNCSWLHYYFAMFLDRSPSCVIPLSRGYAGWTTAVTWRTSKEQLEAIGCRIVNPDGTSLIPIFYFPAWITLMNSFSMVQSSLEAFHSKGGILSLEVAIEYLGLPITRADSTYYALTKVSLHWNCVAFLKLLYVVSLELIFSAWLNCWDLISYQVRLSCSTPEVLFPILMGTRTKMRGIGGCPFRLLVLLSGKEYQSSLLCRH